MNERPSPDEAAAYLSRFSVQRTKQEGKPGYIGTEIIDVLFDGARIGGYERNYSSLYNTFVPFMTADGAAYALYSRDYTATRVMSLPDCVDLGGEESDSYGFCPVDYFVPYDPERGLDGSFGFIAGCVWGDDSSWKVQFLDLSDIKDGMVKRDDRFGYLELPAELTLAEAVDVSSFDRSDRWIRIRNDRHAEIELRDGERDPALDDDDELSPVVDVSRAPRRTPGTEPHLYRAQYFDDRSNWIHSRDDDFFAALARAQRWAQEKNREVRVCGVDDGSWWIICYVQPDGSYHFREVGGTKRESLADAGSTLVDDE
jgi:hypothetical protein